MRRRQYLGASGAALTGLALAGCLGGDGGDGDDDVITIGSDIPYNPFEYENEDGEVVGFDVDIAEAVFADELGYEYEFQPTSFDGIIQALNNGNFRVIMSAMTITDDRAEQVDFSDPYFTAYQTVMVRQDSDIETSDDLRGTTVAVQKGTTGEDAAGELAAEFDDDLTIDSYDQIPDAYQTLRNGQSDAVIADNTVNAEYVTENEGDVRLLDAEEEPEGENAPDYLTLTTEEYGIAFRQNDDDFREEVNGALQAIRDDGRYDEIYGEYFEG